MRECVILSTCLRFEIYAVVPASVYSLVPVEEYLHSAHGISGLTKLDTVTLKEGREAVRHLFSVACGLKSKIMGEKQIVGQIKDAYGTALKLGCTGPVLNRLFQKCLNVSKNVRSRTGIDEGVCSAASLAVKLLLDNHGALHGKRVLIFGAGQLGKLLGFQLKAKGCKDIYFCSRSTENAEALAEQCSAGCIPYGRFHEAIKNMDVLASATGAPHEVIGYRVIDDVMKQRAAKAFCVLDLADPPDVDERVSTIDGVYYYSIRCLDELADETKNRRIAASREARLFIDEAVNGFILSQVRSKSLTVCKA
jgi:glutamyl-tRNA reductase